MLRTDLDSGSVANRKMYRNTVTGVVREYPDSFARLFPSLTETLEEPSCITCQPDPAEVEFPAPAEEPAEDPIEEPAGSADDKEEA